MVPYDAIAIYMQRDNELVPEYVNGDNYRLFNSLRIPLGQGLSGWVAQNRKPIVNGNPSVEPGYLNDPSKFSTLSSALAVPLEGVSGMIGVLALYRAERDAFTSDNLRILLAVSSKMALSIENALKYQQAENSATTDYLTGLPNARSLFLQLERELARCKRDKSSLTVMVSDMDGFKQINDRFGHLEGNRVLRLFAQALKESCREYDYVARMGGDEFVVDRSGTAPRSGFQKSANRFAFWPSRRVLIFAGRKFFRSAWGKPCIPTTGRMRRNFWLKPTAACTWRSRNTFPTKIAGCIPRLKCRVTIELNPETQPAPMYANLTDVSIGGCFVETSAILSPGSNLTLSFSMEDGTLAADGVRGADGSRRRGRPYSSRKRIAKAKEKMY